jgi:hypothetical protein
MVAKLANGFANFGDLLQPFLMAFVGADENGCGLRLLPIPLSLFKLEFVKVGLASFVILSQPRAMT